MESQSAQRNESVSEGQSPLEGGDVRLRDVSLKRVYEDPDSSDGLRVLVDKLWPRGVSKAKAAVDEWAKDLTPSTDLRKWFHEDTAGRWDEFRSAYRRELEEGDAVPAFLSRAPEHVTLVYAGKDAVHNHAKVLRDVLLDAAKWQRGEGSSEGGSRAPS